MAARKRLSKKQQALAYRNSKPLKVRKVEGHPAIDAATDHLFKEMNWISVRYADDHRRHIQVFLLDLYLTYDEDSERYIGFSRNSGAYRPETKWHKKGLSYVITKKVTDFLNNKGYASLKLGFHFPDSPFTNSYQSRIRATDKLINLVESYGVTPEIEDDLPDDDDDNRLVILRATKVGDEKQGKEIDYDDTPETLRMKENLRLINSKLKRHAILLYVTDVELKKLNQRLSQNPSKGPISFKNKSLHRVFNNGSWTQGGRFYGGWWQNIPREYRHLIRLTDKDVVEADFSGLHINMLYAKDKLPMPEGDVYYLPEYPKGKDVFRDFVKRLLLIMVNSEDRDKARKALHKAVHREKSLQLPKEIKSTKAEHLHPVIDAFQRKHQPISHYFCTGVGIDLQYLDSEMAERVLLHFSKMGYAILPMHDSFILHHGLERELQKTMDKAFRGQFGVGCNTDIKYRSIEIRQSQGPSDPGPCETPFEELFGPDPDYPTYERLLKRHRDKLYGPDGGSDTLRASSPHGTDGAA